MKKPRFWVLLVVLVLGISALSFGMVVSNRDNTSRSTVMIHKNGMSSDGLDSKDLEVLVDYKSYVLAEIPSDEINKLKREGYSVNEVSNRDMVAISDGQLNVNDGLPDTPDDLTISSYPSESEGYYIVQFVGPIKPQWKEEMRGMGARFQEFRHRYNFIVKMDEETKHSVKDLDFVNWVGIYQPAYRFDSELLEKSGEQVIEVSFFDGTDLRESVKGIESLGGEIQAIGMNGITAEIHTGRIEKVANLKGVNSISEGSEEPELYNGDATWITETNVQDDRKVTTQGVTGTDQLVTVCDSELYTTDGGHEMWEDPEGDPFGDNHRKVQDYYSIGGDLNSGTYHGSHVTGTVLGDAPDSNGDYLTYNYNDGNALDARLIHQDIGTSGGGLSLPNSMYNDAWQPSYDSGSRVHTNSWGGGISSYTGLAIDGDQFIWDNKDYNILFAMGNSGDGANTLSGEPEGKNFFSIGGVTNYPDQNTMYTSSSRGYADDGRIKPTVLHVAENVVSSDRSYDGYQSLSGTSMATPGLAGQLAQVREYYKKGWYPSGTPTASDGFNPSNALLKSTIINGAVEITGSGAYANDARFPNGDQGFGRSKLDRVLHFDGENRKLITYDSWNENNSLDTGESWTKEFKVDDSTQELEVTLAWSDYPGSDGSDSTDPAIVNDLDLELTTPSGTRYVGNAFTGNNPGYSQPDPTSNPWSGQRSAEYDGLNVEEDILLLPNQNGVEEGTYQLTVSGYNVPQSTQPFGVAISGGVSLNSAPAVDVTAPSENEIINGTYDIQWSATDEEDTNSNLDIKVDYSADGGSTWNTLEDGTGNNDGLLSWDTTTVLDGVNYIVRVNATDSNSAYTVNTSATFSVDNIKDDRWHMQAETPTETGLSMYPVENTQNSVSVGIPSSGEYSLGNWTTDAFGSDTDLGGQWNFTAYGYADPAGYFEGYLKAKLKDSSGTVIHETATDDQDVGSYSSYHQFSWSDTVSGSIASSDTITVELLVDAVSGSSSVIYNETSTGETSLNGTVTNDHTYIHNSDDAYEQIQEETVSSGGVNTLLSESFEGGVPPSGWTQADGPDDGSTNSWYQDATAYDQSNSARIDYDSGDNVDQYLISSAIDASTYSNLQMTFYQHCDWPSYWADNYIEVSTTDTNPSSFTTVKTLSSAAPDSGWEQKTVDLSAYDGESTIYIGFRYYGTNAENWYVDMAEVTGEQTTSGLDHEWTMDIPSYPTEPVEFNVEAYHSSNTEGDDVDFLYSTDGGSTYTQMLTVTKTSDDNSYQTYSMPTDTSGTVYIKAEDTDRTAGNTNLDTLYVDHMYIKASSSDPPSAVMGYDHETTQSWVEPSFGTSSLVTQDISLSSGWNFVSFNLNPSDSSLLSILNTTDYGINGNYDKVEYYDVSQDEWKTFTPDRASHFNSLDTWNREMGLWIHMTTADTLTVEGTKPSSTTITLQPGWNMVGYPSSTDTTASDTLPGAVTKMAVYDGSQEYNLRYEYDLTTVTMSAKNGYWVYNGDSTSVDWAVSY